MDKTNVTIEAYNACAANFATKFMDLKLYKDNLNKFMDRLPSAAKILDLGCGPGNVARLLLEQQKDFQVIGIDLSPEMIRLAKKMFPLPPSWLATLETFLG